MSKLLSAALRLVLSHRNVAAERVRNDSGQSLVELALVLPTFFVLMIGFINFCIIMFGLCNLSFASRQADRYACLHSSTSLLPVTQPKIDALVAPYVFKYPSNTYSDLLSYPTGTNIVGGTASVKITITYKIVLPFLTTSTIPLSFTASGTIVQ